MYRRSSINIKSYLLRVISRLVVIHLRADNVSDTSGASSNSSGDPEITRTLYFLLIFHNLQISPVQSLRVALLQREAALVDIL